MIDETLLVTQRIPLPDQPQIPNPVPLTFGTYYRFQRAGVELAEHTHTDKTAHFTIVISGGFEITEAGVTRKVTAGDIVDLGVLPHSFTALEDESTLVNVRKAGITDGAIEAIKAEADVALAQITAKLTALKV